MSAFSDSIKSLSERGLLPLAALVASALVFGLCLSFMLSEARELEDAKETLSSIETLGAEYLGLKRETSRLETRMRFKKSEGIIQVVEQAMESLGLKDKIASVKPEGSKDLGYAAEETAEVKLEKLTMNEAVNALYAIERSASLFIVRKAELKKPFDSPDRLNITLTLSLASSK